MNSIEGVPVEDYGKAIQEESRQYNALLNNVNECKDRLYDIKSELVDVMSRLLHKDNKYQGEYASLEKECAKVEKEYKDHVEKCFKKLQQLRAKETNYLTSVVNWQDAKLKKTANLE
jgi:predicted  nucleic acid-binding Zn-ribbon protein